MKVSILDAHFIIRGLVDRPMYNIHLLGGDLPRRFLVKRILFLREKMLYNKTGQRKNNDFACISKIVDI